MTWLEQQATIISWAILDYPRALFGLDTSRVWWRTPNPMLGGMVPRDWMQAHPQKTMRFIYIAWWENQPPKSAKIEYTNPYCMDCKRPYNFPDVYVDTELFKQIDQEDDPPWEAGMGLYCPSCLCERLKKTGLRKVTATIYLRPLRLDEEEDDEKSTGTVHS